MHDKSFGYTFEIFIKWQIPVKATTMNPVFITQVVVQKSIKGLKKPGGAGPDGLPSEFYRNTVYLVDHPLSVIYNIPLQTGSVPSIWKHAVITPVFKKDHLQIQHITTLLH